MSCTRTAPSPPALGTLPASTMATPPPAHSLESAPAPPLVEPSAATPPPPRPTERFTLSDEKGRPIEVYPPFAHEGRSPLLVVLHATCMKPASVCDWFGSAGRDQGWLVCPSGNSTCYDEPDWNGTGPAKASFLQHAIDAVGEKIPSYVSDRPGVLIGWSRGAFAARDILYASVSDDTLAPLAKRFRGLVLMAAKVTPDVHLLRKAGIERVVMAAGDYDGSMSTMAAAVATLRASHIEARYVSLGRIGHVWPEDFEARMREPIAWVAGDSAGTD